jgi:pimeloyl-ACP methyl ester carboxylesterase
VLDALGLPRVVYWGYSGGATVGYALAAAHPQRVAALIASGVISGPDEPTSATMAEAQTLASTVRAEGMDALVRAYATESEPMTPWFRKQMLDTDPEVFARQLLALDSWSGPWPLLGRITCPTLMLVGEREDPDGFIALAATRAPNARCVTFPGLDHITAYERSDLALAQALPFLRALQLS